ncbi:MAG: DUF3332 domain-containing protein [Marinilabiliales bacterium]|nr:DUF3332 domain-containing protein [Marinilabiliales bacterium]
MRKLRVLVAICLLAGMSISLSGCYGSFSLTRKLYNWNGTVGGKLANEAVFLVLNIIPVYGVTTFVDAVLLNSVEFWTGSKALALKDGVNKVQFKGQEVTIVLKDGNATILDNHLCELARLRYSEKEKTWYATMKGTTRKVMTIHDQSISFYPTSGETLTIDGSQWNAMTFDRSLASK